jgi:hypothetical protein
VGLNSLKSLNLTNVYPNNKNKVKSKPLELYELAGKKIDPFLLQEKSAKVSLIILQHGWLAWPGSFTIQHKYNAGCVETFLYSFM